LDEKLPKKGVSKMDNVMEEKKERNDVVIEMYVTELIFKLEKKLKALENKRPVWFEEPLWNFLLDSLKYMQNSKNEETQRLTKVLLKIYERKYENRAHRDFTEDVDVLDFSGFYVSLRDLLLCDLNEIFEKYHVTEDEMVLWNMLFGAYDFLIGMYAFEDVIEERKRYREMFYSRFEMSNN